MMARHDRDQEQLFYSFCLDEMVPDDHHVRAIAAVLDLSWVYAELASYYPKIGRPSIDPGADDPDADRWLCVCNPL
jgi:transposase